MLNPFALVTAAVVVVMVVLLFRTDDQLRRARILTWFGFGLTAAVSAFLLLFLVGESNVNEPGFVGMTAAWLLPIVVLGLAALLLPTIAVWILAAICVIEIAFGMWWYLDNTTWLDAMQGNGPASLADNPYRLLHLVVSNLGLGLTVGLMILGLTRATWAGALLIVHVTGPVLILLLMSEVPAAVVLAKDGGMAIPILITGLCYLAAGSIMHRIEGIPRGIHGDPRLLRRHRAAPDHPPSTPA